jgi:flagellar motility protein MotE (MotC chaperone)
MKNFLILGLLAAFLFSVSAALSVWLNQSKQPDATEKDKDKDKALAKGPKGSDPKEAAPEPRPAPPKDPAPPPGSPESTAKYIKEQQAALERRAAQLDMVVRDLQTQREATEAALARVMNELKNVSTETTKLDALAEDLKKKKLEFEVGEKKNIEKIAAMYDAMTPEAAAPILKQMADTGRLDMAAKVLAQMKDRKAASVLEAMNDPALALQILERIRALRATTAPAPGPTPVIPAKGP